MIYWDNSHIFKSKILIFFEQFLIFLLFFAQDVDHLAAEVSQLVYRLAGGIGPEPQLVNNTANGLANWIIGDLNAFNQLTKLNLL